MGAIKIIRKHISVVVFVVAMIVAFIPRYGKVEVGDTLKYGIAAAIILWGVIDFLRKRRTGSNKDVVFFLKLYLIPAVIIHLYSIVMSLIGVMDTKYLSTNVSAYIPILLTISSVQIFGRKALKYDLIALAIAWVISVVGIIIAYGFGVFPYAIMQGYFGDGGAIMGVTSNYLEMSDLVLTTTCIIISFVFFKMFGDKSKKHPLSERIILVIIVAAFLLGLKRISILAAFASLFFLFVLKKIPERAKKKMYSTAGILLAILSFGYVVMLFSGEGFYNMMDSLGINMMGRDFYYKVIVEESTLSPTFLGRGRNSVSKMMTTDYKYMRVGGVHNDLLKMYVENGFVLFLLWVWYFTIWMTKKYGSKYGTKPAILYMALTICTFILYMTDNVENYFMYQLFYMMIPITYAMNFSKGRAKDLKSLVG